MEQLSERPSTVTANFASTLNLLPAADHIARIELFTSQQPEVPVAVLKNEQGTAGSVRVYLYVCHKHGVLDKAAAEEALALFSEHTENARNNPGAHPNIDRLFEIVEKDLVMQFRITER